MRLVLRLLARQWRAVCGVDFKYYKPLASEEWRVRKWVSGAVVILKADRGNNGEH